MDRTKDLTIDQALCTACYACLLACHYHHTGRFGISSSSVHVEYDADTSRLSISFDSTCDLCVGEDRQLCAYFCVPGAIQNGVQVT